jgi:hypothetical protein
MRHIVAGRCAAFCCCIVDTLLQKCHSPLRGLSLRASRSGCAPLRGAIARAVALALLARRFAARVPPSCSAVALLSLPASRAVGRAPLLRRALPASRGAVGGASLLRRSSPLRVCSPGLAAVAARRRAHDLDYIHVRTRLSP